jgi:hypothetical protein
MIFVELHFPRPRTQHGQPDPDTDADRERQCERRHLFYPLRSTPTIRSLQQPGVVKNHRADATRNHHRRERPNQKTDHRRRRRYPQPQLLPPSLCLGERKMRRDHRRQERNLRHEREAQEGEAWIADEQPRRHKRLPSRRAALDRERMKHQPAHHRQHDHRHFQRHRIPAERMRPRHAVHHLRYRHRLRVAREPDLAGAQIPSHCRAVEPAVDHRRFRQRMQNPKREPVPSNHHRCRGPSCAPHRLLPCSRFNLSLILRN